MAVIAAVDSFWKQDFSAALHARSPSLLGRNDEGGFVQSYNGFDPVSRYRNLSESDQCGRLRLLDWGLFVSRLPQEVAEAVVSPLLFGLDPAAKPVEPFKQQVRASQV